MARTFSLKNYRPYRLCLATTGPHRFGGEAIHQGSTPAGTNTALHHFLSLDLTDPNCPVKSEIPFRWLPLYYPLKYGVGGPEIQYLVHSDSEIKIIYMSDELPDDEENQYVRVSELPEARAELIPLEYEEARILGFLESTGYFWPNEDDSAILQRLDRDNLIEIGGRQESVRNAQAVVCRNTECKFFNRRVHFEVIASVPPIHVNGTDDFWYEFQGGDMEFCFGLCYYCGTIIAFNRSR